MNLRRAGACARCGNPAKQPQLELLQVDRDEPVIVLCNQYVAISASML